MGEVRTDDEKIIFSKVWLQHSGYLLKDVQTLGSYDYRHNRRHISEKHLQERQLHLQAVFPVVCIASENKVSSAISNQLLPQSDINRNLSQRRFCKGVHSFHAGSGEPHPVTWPKKEYPLIGVSLWNPVKCRRRHLPAEDVAGMRDYYRLRSGAGI